MTLQSLNMNYPKRPRAKIHASDSMRRSYVEDLKNLDQCRAGVQALMLLHGLQCSVFRALPCIPVT